MTSAPAIGFDYRPSRLPACLIGAVTVLALVAIALAGVPWSVKLILILMAVGFAAHAVRRIARLSIAGVGLAGETWTLYRTDRSDAPARLASFRVLGSCILLRLETGGRVEALLLAPDNSDADLRRRLRMRLAALQPTVRAADL